MKKWFLPELKFWIVMKICAVQGMMAMIIFGVSMAHTGNGQLLEARITLSLKNVSLETALKEIERISNARFVFSPNQINLRQTVSVEATGLALGDVLEDLFTPLKVKFKVHEKEYSITLRGSRKGEDVQQSETNKLAPVTVTGKVTGGVRAEPLAGVNVLIKGTTNGTTTDSDGKFAIQADERDVLVFSFIGYVSVELQVNGRTTIDVVLEEDSRNLNEVIVNAGYWEVKDKEQTGNIARITADEIKTQPVSNPLQAMAGRMAGVTVTQETGVAGGGLQVQIRGRNSISSGNDPLYIIDGIPVLSSSLKSGFAGGTLTSGSPFSTLNPNDIQSIEVLKDGAATAVYGSRGANGVILITTKKGAAGKTKVDVSFSTGITEVSRSIKTLNTKNYLTMRREAFRNDGLIPSTANGYDLLLWDTTRYTDWQKQLIGNRGITRNVTASVSGGDKFTQFLVSGGYYTESMVFPGDFGFKRGSGSFSLNHKSLNERFDLQLSVNYQMENNSQANGDFTLDALTLSPNAPELYVNGKLNWGPSQTFTNPYANLLKKFDVDTRNLRNNAQLRYMLIPGLTLKANLGYAQITTDTHNEFPITSNNPKLGVTTGQAYFATGSNESWIAEPQIEFKRTFGESAINALGGITFQQNTKATNTIRGSGYVNDQLLNNLQAAPLISVLDATTTQYRYQAVFGRVNYTLKQKYIFDIVGRRDGSSRFGPNNRFANFGSVSSAWIFTGEPFIKQNLRFLSFGKLRASYGASGNDQIGDFGYLDTYTAATVSYQGNLALHPRAWPIPTTPGRPTRNLRRESSLAFLKTKYLSL